MNPKPQVKKVVLAYSGGLDTSVIVPWLKENYGCEVVCFCADVGQGDEDLSKLEGKAIASGASKFIVHDMKEEFAADYLFPMLRAGAVYERKYLLGTSVARPLIAKHLVDVAHDVGADAISHGATGKGNDQVRFEAAFAALGPDLEIIAPWREWDLRSREQLLAYLDERGIPCMSSLTKIYSRDRNLWHISHEGGAIENPWNAPPEDAWMLTASPQEAPDEPTDVHLTFERGRPVALNGTKLPGHELVARLNVVAAKNGVGRVDLVENRCVGMKSRGLYETPGGTVIVEALRGLEELTLDRESLHFRQELGLKFARLVYDGRWFTSVRDSISHCVEKIAERTTGEVVVRLYKGTATTIRRKSPFSLYSEDFATFGVDEVYNQKHAEGFIRLFTLPERIAALNGMALTTGKKALSPEDPGVAPFIGPRTGPIAEPEFAPLGDPIIKEGNAV